MLDNWRKVFGGIINVIGGLIIALLFGANLIRTTTVSYTLEEVVSFNGSFKYLIFVPIVAILLWVGMRLYKKINTKVGFLILTAVYFIAAAYILLNTEPFIRHDAESVWNAAGSFLQGDFSSAEKDGYIGQFPFQLGLVTYEMVLRFFCNNEKILFVANLLEIIVINWFFYKITDKLFHNETVNKLGILIEFAFLPQFFFIMFGYGIIPGFCCFTVAIYFCICLWQDFSAKNAVLMVVFEVLASLLKSNYQIGAIAMAIVLVLKVGESRGIKVKNAIVAVVMIVFAVSAPKLIKIPYSIVSGIDIGDGTPITVHIAMGTDLKNEMRAPGWYDGYTTSAYPDAGYDTEVASENAKAKIKNNFEATLKNPTKALSFYWRKIVSTWCDPMFQSVWSGPINGYNGGHPTQTKLLSSLYSGEKIEKAIALFCKVIVTLILGLSLVFVIINRKRYPATMVLYLYLMGGFAFHLFSETKSQYVYMYVFTLIPMAAYELNTAKELVLGKIKK